MEVLLGLAEEALAGTALHAVGDRPHHDLAAVDRVGDLQPVEEPAVGAVEGDEVAAVLTQRVGREIALAPVQLVHHLDVLVVEALVDVLGDDPREELADAEVAAHARHRRDDLGRAGDRAHAQRRREGLAEAVDPHDVALGVEAQQRGDLLAVVAQLAVHVVLEHDELVLVGELEHALARAAATTTSPSAC